MIIIRIAGGLGNQMFQYALYRKMILDGYPVRLDDYRICRDGNQHNGLELKRDFSLVEYQTISAPRYYLCEAMLHAERLYRRKIKANAKYVVNDDVTGFIPYVDLISRRSRYLNGYWQSEEYFKSIERDIRQNFQFKNIDRKNLEYGNRMEEETSVSVHIRRGDYLANPQIAYYQGSICSLAYYKRAVQYCKDCIPDCKFYIFSDDVDWVRENFGFLNYELVNWNRGADSYKDMYLMSCCRHHIIANSTFSWWGAWLGDSPEKVVVAPEVWVRESKCDHILPPNWIRIATD